MPTIFAPHEIRLLDRLVGEAGLDRRDFGWWREQGSPAGYECRYSDGHWGPFPVEAHRFRHSEGDFVFAVVAAIGAEERGAVRRRSGAPLPPDPVGLFHVWGSAGRWRVPGDPEVPVAFPELIAHFREWARQVTIHLGASPQTGNQPSATIHISNSSVGGVFAGSVANVTLFTPVSTDAAAFAADQLRALTTQLDGQVDVEALQRSLFREAIAGALAEATKPKPNPIALGGMISALAAAPQGLAAWPQAYPVLKGIAAALGLPIP